MAAPNDEAEREIAALYASHASGLLRYALTLTSDAGGAQDALQEIFLRYFLLRNEGQQVANPRAWLFQVLRNHLLDQLKSCGARNEVAIEGMADLADCRQSAEQHYQSAETARKLARLLSPREWECVRLRAEGLSYEEIGEIMDLRKGTVGGTLIRAHRKFRRALERGEGQRPSAVQQVYAALRKEDSHSSRSGSPSGLSRWRTDRPTSS